MSAASSETLARAAKIRLILLDVDGVLTDGGIHLHSDGTESRAFHVRDGMGIRLGQQAGLVFGIISGRESEVVRARASELGISELHQRVLDKGTCFDEIAERHGLAAEEICFVGDDVIDIPVMARAGLAVAPADAIEDALNVAHHVTRKCGGKGAVREVIDLVLAATGSRKKVLEPFTSG